MTDSQRLAMDIGGVTFQNPVWVGSSEFSLTEAGICTLAQSAPGAIVAKSVNESPEARRNLGKARYILLPDARSMSGRPLTLDAMLLNRSGLAPFEVDEWCRMLVRAQRTCAAYGTVLIGSVTVGSLATAPSIVQKLSEAVGHVEVNVGAPHAREIPSDSITNVLDPDELGSLVADCRSRCSGLLIVKLPRSGPIAPALARAAFANGANAVTLEGRAPGIMVDPYSGAPLLETAGAFGSSHELPASLYAVSKVAELVGDGAPLIGTNGARTGEDVMRFILCGATCVEVVSALAIRGTEYLQTLTHELGRCLDSFGERPLADLVALSRGMTRGYSDDDLEREDFTIFLRGIDRRRSVGNAEGANHQDLQVPMQRRKTPNGGNDMRIETVLEGLIDTHCHPAPSAMPREFDAATGARDGWNKLRMAGMVYKCHHHNTQMDVLAQQLLIADIPTELYGAVALNSSVGGLNLAQVQMCLGLGGKMVYLPTVSSGRHIDNHPEHAGFPRTMVEVTVEKVAVADDAGSVVPELLPIFDCVSEHGAVLNGGHLHPDDIRACFTTARERGVERFLVSHPDFVIEADPEECNEYVEMGAFIEHELHMYDPGAKMQWPLSQLKRWIDVVGVENTVIGSDLGQKGFPWPADAFIRVGEGLRAEGVSDEDLRTIFHDNPRRLFAID